MEEERKPWSRPRRKRLGDAVEAILKPAVEIVDKVTGTNFKGCGGCQQRKEWLNKLDEEITGE